MNLSSRTLTLLLMASDGFGVYVSFNLAYWIRLRHFSPDYLLSWPLLGVIFLVLVSFYILDLFDPLLDVSGFRLPSLSFFAVGLVGGGLVLVFFFFGIQYSQGVLGRGVLVLGLFLLGCWAAGTRYAAYWWVQRHMERNRWLMIFEDEYFESFLRDFKARHRKGRLHYLVKPDSAQVSSMNHSKDGIEVIGTWNDLERISGQSWSGIILGLPTKTIPDSMIEELMRYRLAGGRVMDLNDFYERELKMVPVFHLHDGWFVTSHGFDLLHNKIGRRLKGILEYGLAMVMLILLCPVMAMVALAIVAESRGGAFYRQERTGRGGVPFTIIKFRSMVDNAEKDGPAWAESNDPRTTMIGRLIRVSRLDELPQLLNVLRGEMSFIGPRPERPVFNQDLERAIPYYRLRHLVKPGITGWAQVNYPYGASVEDARIKLGFELFYIKNYSLLLDVRIILDTIRVVLMGRGR